MPYTDNTSYCIGQCIPRFHERKRNGELLPFTSWEQFSQNCSYVGSQSYTYLKNGTGFHESHDIEPIWDSQRLFIIGAPYCLSLLNDFSDFTNEVNRAAAQLYSKNGHDTLTFLSELGKTRQMLMQFGRNALKFAKTKRLKKKDLLQPGKWLEARYGWRPLLYDLQDLSKAIDSLSEDKTLRNSERSGHNETDVRSSQKNGSWGGGTYVYGYVDDITVSIRGSVVADILPPAFRFNAAVTAWELVPYSFVIDWAIDVGTYLEALSFLTIASDYKAAGGYKVTVSRESYRYPTSWNTYYSGSFNTTGTSSAEFVKRIPTSVGKLPSFQLRLNEFKVVDLLLLVKQKLGLRR